MKPQPKIGHRLLQHLGRDRRRAVDDQAQAREVGLADLRRLQQEQDHRRHQQHDLQPLALDDLEDLRRDELAHHVVGGAGEQAGNAPAAAADVEHRQADEVGTPGASSQVAVHSGSSAPKLALVSSAPLGSPVVPLV